MQEITTDKLYHLTINSEYTPLPDSTISKVIAVMMIEHMHNMHKSSGFFAPAKFYRDIEWRWMADRGSLTRRISRWYNDQYSMNISPISLSAIGNIVRDEILKNQDYHIDFTSRFNWNDGDFGDSGSCFWSSNVRARDGMQQSGKFIAVRFFKRSDYGKNYPGHLTVSPSRHMFYTEENRYAYSGYARAWICKEFIPLKDKLYPVWILINGYGVATKQIASIVAAFHNQSVKPIYVTNNTNLHGGLYINGKGYLIGPESLIKNQSQYDFGVPLYGEANIKAKFLGKALEVRKPFSNVVIPPLFDQMLERMRDNINLMGTATTATPVNYADEDEFLREMHYTLPEEYR